MALGLTNTLSGQTAKVVPGNREHVGLYVCVSTVYNFANVGNARPAMVLDVSYRLLKCTYARVTYARNVRLVRELLDNVPGQAIRFALLSAHYLISIDLSDRSLGTARH